jgi:hypothetical protein
LAAKHALPHPPQLSTSVDVFTSQPFAEAASQSARGARQDETVQTPFWQLGVPPVVVQGFPQPPQLSTFLVVSTSHPFALCASQSENPVVHFTEHAPSAQVAVALFVEQAWPHPAQFAGSVSVFTSQPSSGLPLQSAYPCLHAPMAHEPFEQTAVAFAGAQIAPQLPQLAVSRFLFVSQPSVGSPLQSPRGATHVSILQTPPSHFAAAPAN